MFSKEQLTNDTDSLKYKFIECVNIIIVFQNYM